MKILVSGFLIFLLFQMGGMAYAQAYDFSDKIPYQVKERIVLEDSVKHTNVNDYWLCEYGDSVIVFTQEKSKKEIVFHFQVYALDGTKGSLRSVVLNKPEQKYLERRWIVSQIVMNNDYLHLLFSEEIWRLPFPGKAHTYFKKFELKESYDIISVANNKLFVQRVGIPSNPKYEKKVVLTQIEFDKDEIIETVIDGHTPDCYFLMFFEPRVYYGIDPSGEYIVKLYNDKPKFDVLDMQGNVVLTHEMDVPWEYFEEEEIIELNKKADRNPNAVFEALHDRFFDEIYVNARVDFLGEDKFLISQIIPGQHEYYPDSAGYNPEAALYEFTNNEVRYIKSYPAHPYMDEYDGRIFSFTNSKEKYFFFKNNNRFQLGIFPYFDPALTNEDEITHQQEESFLNNRFQLCLYIGELKP